MDDDRRSAALDRLGAFVGEWDLESGIPLDGDGGDAGGRPRTWFEWTLDRQFLVQRTEIPHPAAPDGLMVYATAGDGAGYTQHYFDSRGVVRIYAMTFDGREWTLTRERPDFTPLEFSQRWTATFDDDGRAIHGRWEQAREGSGWELDFELTYTRPG